MKINISRSTIFSISFIIWTGSIKAQSITDYVKSHAIEVNEEFIQKNVRFYLNRRAKNGNLNWFDGSVISTDGTEYKGLKLKFNTIDNSVNIKLDSRFYRINSPGLTGFKIINKNKFREFRKGFTESRVHVISATYSCNSIELLKHLTSFIGIDEFNILDFEMANKDGKNNGLYIRLLSPSVNSTQNLQAYLLANQDIEDVQIELKELGMDDNIFFEIIADGDNGMLLKRYSKRSTQSDAVSLVKNSNVVTFDKFEYYLSNPNNGIRPIYLNKKSIKKAIKYTGINKTRRVPMFVNEKKLIVLFNKIL